MSRTRAEALVLVNWKGVFYERYLLDRHVTALEGANGAGKTTVMIAAYVVLLPDMSRLRFTNLGETGATGGDKGIWGRLGKPGRPAYAALDFAVAGGRRLIAGVHLERKGEPSVEPTPFVVTGLGSDVRLQDLLLVRLGDTDAVPELTELRENAARLGGRLQVFASARDYFGTLFDEGVTPLRLATDEDRNKLNEMLRTSMTGGISRALTSELRAFLLKEEGGLADTLQRMRANLDACRRTRAEVHESRRLQQEIGGIFEAGQTMFAAAILATRERADDLSRRVAEADAARAAAVAERDGAIDALARTTSELEMLEQRRAELEQGLDSARASLTRARGALAAAEELARRELALLASSTAAEAAAAARTAAAESRDRKREVLRKAQENHKRAASGLADLQAGIEELHRCAGAYRQAVRRLREAEQLLGGVAIAPTEFEEHLAGARAQLAAVDDERRHAATRLADADDHRRRHADVFGALRSLAGADVSVADAYRIAVDCLRRHRAQVALSERVSPLAKELEEARALAARQSRARADAEKLGLAPSSQTGPAGSVVRGFLDELEATREAHEEHERDARADIASAERTHKELQGQLRELAAREPRWREHDARAKRLGDRLGWSVVDRVSLDRARTTIAEDVASIRTRAEGVRLAQERYLTEARELLASGGPFAPDLLRLRDQLDAELVAERFDGVAPHEAGPIEAKLGALAHALVVDDPLASAHSLRSRPDALSDVLLVSRTANLDDVAAAPDVDAGSPDVVVQEGIALRVSRIPSRPRLGRRAREERASELRAQAEGAARELDGLRSQQRSIERLALDADALLSDHGVWLAGDPAAELAVVRRKATELQERIAALRATVAEHADAARALRPRIGGVRAILTEVFLLDPPDYGERARSLETEHQNAVRAQAEARRTSHFAEVVDAELAVLRTPPLSEHDVSVLRSRVDDLRQSRERLDAAVDALDYVRSNADALSWHEAPSRLASQQALLPALDAQLREAEAAQEAAQRVVDEAEGQYDTATGNWHEADGRRRRAQQEYAAASEHFESFAIVAPNADMARACAEEVSRHEDALRIQSGRRDDLLTTRGRQESACQEAERRTKEADEKLTSERREAEPAIARWERLRERAMERGLLAGVLAPGETEVSGLRGHVNLVQEAHTQRKLLVERLRSAQGGATLLAELEILRDATDAAFADGYFDLWLTVRDWLRRRLPAQIAEVDDPREALLRLRDQLASLEERLSRQEDELRGASEDVARGIDVQVRKARGQINRLNRNLDGLGFGSIRGIRVRLQPVDRMEQVLRALREGAAQELLFQEDLPIEQALDEIFRRYGDGRTGGQRLLDYREYVHLQVEIRRSAGNEWEIANPTRLSTGEAIGVGAALMMVVLTEWERDANLLRGKRSWGSLRFLFLDEANRLSHENLGVLFDLCQTLDLQLLIASPEVARAEGNTTYRLVRRITEAHEEEVIVSGRRTRVEA